MARPRDSGAIVPGAEAGPGPPGRAGALVTATSLPAASPTARGRARYATGERELYDARTDPHQLQNGARTAAPALLAGLAARTAALARCRGAECRRAEDAPLAAILLYALTRPEHVADDEGASSAAGAPAE